MDGARVLVTARFAAELTGRPLSTIRDRRSTADDPERGPVACHVGTGALYWVGTRLGVELSGLARQPHRRNVGRKGIVGHAAPTAQSVT